MMLPNPKNGVFFGLGVFLIKLVGHTLSYPITDSFTDGIRFT